MKHLSLRFRIFLFFCLVALGSLAIIILALWFGFRQLNDADAISAFVTAGVVAGLGVVGLVVFIWLLFDDNVSKPVERIAASLRVRTHVDVSTPIDVTSAKYLGDLAPAASAMGGVLDKLMQTRAAENDLLLAGLTTQRDQLVEILSDIPIATILLSANHKIVLYDGQAAALMDRVGKARLKTSVFDYFDETAILDALEQMGDAHAARLEIAVTTKMGTVCSGHIRAFGAGAGYTLMLSPLEPTQNRPLTYDFDLLTSAPSASLRDTALQDLVFVVFDTETTGLNPVTDNVVQLGAVRVVNGKMVPGEVFDTLVNPGVPIPARSTNVHGISTDMVKDAPPFSTVCTSFHGFSTGSIVVAHNAAFDMAFLHRQAPEIDCFFDQPVLDTVLLSSAVFGGSATHTLDAICERLDIIIPAEHRHTAMGDAVATAKALIAMIAILQARGIKTYGALHDEAEKHRRSLKT